MKSVMFRRVCLQPFQLQVSNLRAPLGAGASVRGVTAPSESAGRPGEEGARAEPTGPPNECREPPGLGVLTREAGSVSTAATMTGKWESSRGWQDGSGGIGAEKAEAGWLQ